MKYAVRFLVRSRSYSLINLFGLAFSLACSIILLRYIHRELTVDTHCVDREQVIIPLRNINNNLSFSNTSLCDTAYIPESKIVGRSYINMNEEEPFRYNEQPYTLNTIFGDNHFLELFRFKTGTPARVDKRSIDFSKTKEQPGSTEPLAFSYMTKTFNRPMVPCHSTYTNPRTHEIIRENLHLAPNFQDLLDHQH